MIIVPDTSVLIDGRITRLIRRKEYRGSKILVPEAVVAELENQANRGMESGFKGLDELVQLRDYADKKIVELQYVGKRPTVSEFKDNDEMIRNAAKENNGTLVTSDRIQASIAKSKGIQVRYLKPHRPKKRLRILDYFDEETMSVHLRDRVVPMAKKGKPGHISLMRLSDEPSTEKELSGLASDIIEYARTDPDSFVEIERKGATVVQLRQLRIAIARPPFSDGFEITAVRPIAEVKLEDYELSDKLLKRLEKRAEGILVAGPPGAGKSTFSQSLAEFYKDKGVIVKTMESPRDLVVSDEITQYAPLEGDMEKTADILLLVRPDYTIYDEVRKTRDFEIFSDMRLAGVGMVGVVHANKAIDAIQRLIGRVELGMIPQIVDTVIFIKDGEIKQVYKVGFTVKVPEGMIEADLARPVIEVRDFESDTVEYEIYSFGEETIVMPVALVGRKSSPTEKLASEVIAKAIRKLAKKGMVDVEVKGSSATVWVDEQYIPKVIGKQGRNIEKIEKAMGVHIDVRSTTEKTESMLRALPELRYPVMVEETEKHLLLKMEKSTPGRMIRVYADEEFIFAATVGRKGEIRISKGTDLGRTVLDALETGIEIYAVGTEK
ncbi:MAG: PINc/VapC family ATPase [Candidatus Hydrothermarchaeaceae archaeon]